MDYHGISKRILLFSFVICAAVSAQATTIRQIGTTQLVNESELVFEGRAQDRWSAHNGNAIVTYVRFEVMEVVKGEFAGPTLTLQFLGGTVDGQAMRIAASNIPEVGEHGVYFVESTTEPLVNPLYGWKQGQFVVQAEGVYTADKHPVTAFAGQASPDALIISTSHALGVTANAAQDAPALTLQQFKDRVRELVVEPVKNAE